MVGKIGVLPYLQKEPRGYRKQRAGNLSMATGEGWSKGRREMWVWRMFMVQTTEGFVVWINRVFFHLWVSHAKPQMGWLKTREFYFLPILKVESLKSRCQQGCIASGGSREESVSSFFLLLVVVGISSLVAATLQTIPLCWHHLFLPLWSPPSSLL